MKIAKFGGTSLASAEQIKKVAQIVMDDSERRLIVVSAPGKRDDADTKVTDLLIACAEKQWRSGEAEDELQAVIERYRQIALGLEVGEDIVTEIENDLRKRLALETQNEGRFLDAMKAAGEDNCAKLVACYLQTQGVEASYVNPKEAGLIVTDEPGNAQVLPEAEDNLQQLKQRQEVMIFPGFFGYSKEGNIVTFPRGGSDITGAILAGIMKADLYENFTDVDSVYAVNPSLVDHPQEIEELTYREMRELSYAGFSVFHEEALIPAFRAGVPVCVKNTNNPSAPGTMIVNKRTKFDRPVAGIASASGFCSINVSKYLMNREVGYGRKLLQILEDEGLPYEHAPSGIDNISVILKEEPLTKEVEMRVIDRIQSELDTDDIEVEHDFALVMIVGEGMKSSIGVADKATAAFAKAGVNLVMINQGSSEVSMMFGVRATDADKSVISLYKEFFENGK